PAVRPEEADDPAEGGRAAPGPGLQVGLAAASPWSAAHHQAATLQSMVIERKALASAIPAICPRSAARSRAPASTSAWSEIWLTWQKSASSPCSKVVLTSRKRFGFST